MSITALFQSLGAPLKSIRRSWGAINRNSGEIFLRVWEDETLKLDGKRYVLLTNKARFEGTSDFGYRERKEHIELIKAGHPRYLIFCFAKDAKATPRQLKTYQGDRIFPADELIEHDGDIWIEFS